MRQSERGRGREGEGAKKGKGIISGLTFNIRLKLLNAFPVRGSRARRREVEVLDLQLNAYRKFWTQANREKENERDKEGGEGGSRRKRQRKAKKRNERQWRRHNELLLLPQLLHIIGVMCSDRTPLPRPARSSPPTQLLTKLRRESFARQKVEIM